MKERNKFQWLLTLAALPFLATAAASAHQWISTNAPIEASVSIDSVLPSTRVHNIVLNRAGGIEGRITMMNSNETVALDSLSVFFIQNGEVVSESSTDQNGKFFVENIGQGPYSFIATGETGFAVYGVNVVEYQAGASDNIMEAAAVSPNMTIVKQILEENLPQEVAQEILEDSSNITEDMVGGNRVKLNNGTLNGHVIPLLGEIANAEGTSIFIVRQGQKVAQVIADANGAFSIEDFKPGVYDFVATGPTGFAAISFEAVADTDTARSSFVESDEIPVAIAPQGSSTRSGGFGSGSVGDGGFGGGQVFDGGFVDGGFGGGQVYDTGSLDVALASPDAGFVDFGTGGCSTCGGGCDTCSQSVAAPVEVVSESFTTGGACGGSCGCCGDFSGIASAPRGGALRGGGRLLGGQGLGGVGLRRLLLLGGLAGGVVAIAVDDDEDVASPIAPN